MTRYAMAIDLRRCNGCQTCATACRGANATPAGVQWRQVLDMETGEFPDVRRAFVPTGCMHCGDPPCEHVCPTTATKKRSDGLVTIDYDICIGCGYCAVACPYQARHIVHRNEYAYGEGRPTEPELARMDPARLSVATKCTFCKDRIDAARDRGLTPGVDPEATPACVNACITQAYVFGDLDDPESELNKLLGRTTHFRMHEELGTEPGIFYVWDGTEAER